MRRICILFALALAMVSVTADSADAGPIRRLLGGERTRSTAVSRTRTFSLGVRSSGGCANGQCASASAAASTAKKTVAVPPAPTAPPVPKKKTP